MKSNLLVIIFIFFQTAFSFADEADLYPVKLEEKLNNSQTILFGKVVNQFSYWENGLIYTDNTIRVDDLFKGEVSSLVTVRTVGGTVGSKSLVTSSLLKLELHETGLFFLNKIQGSEKFEVYASKQGFFKLDNDKFVCPFFESDEKKFIKELSILYPSKKSKSYYSNVPKSSTFIQNVSFSPSVITSGTGSILNLYGTGFGNLGPDTANYVAFADPDMGGAPYFEIVENTVYQIWTDTLISLIVPTRAGNGPIQLTLNGITEQTIDSLIIPLSLLNPPNHTIAQHISSNLNGGLTFTFNGNMNYAGGAGAPFTRAFDTWRCATGINWEISSSTTTIDYASAFDGINVVARSSVATGVLGVCYNHLETCNGSDWNVYGQDIIFKDYFIGGGNWNYDISAPTPGYYDFESVALHELGHAHQLGHVVNENDVMHYALPSGTMRRTLSVYNEIAGTILMNESTTTNGCFQSPMILDFPQGCTANMLTDVWVNESSNPLSNNTCIGPTDVYFSFINLGLDTVNSVHFNWSINGVQQSPLNWYGNVGFNETIDSIYLGTHSFNNSNYNVQIWCDSVNGALELNQLNDTFNYYFTGDLCMPNNAGVYGASPYVIDSCINTLDLYIDIYNDGSNDLNSCWIIVDDLNGGIDSVYWTGVLPPNNTLFGYYVGDYGSPYPSRDFKIYTKNPNGVVDANPNDDTLSYTVFPQKLKGIYSVGGLDPDFQTPEMAINHLNTYGVCGDVTFNIRPGVYELHSTINYNNPNEHTIIFQSENQDTSSVTLLPNPQFSPSPILTVYHSRNIYIKHLSFLTDLNLGFYSAFLIGGDSKNITVDSCRFATYYISGSTSHIEIHSSSPGSTFVDSIFIKNCSFINAAMAIEVGASYQANSTVKGKNIYLHNNYIEGTYASAFRIEDTESIDIGYNELNLDELNIYNGSAIEYLHLGTDTARIHHNNFTIKLKPVAELSSNSNSGPAPILVYNNSFSQEYDLNLNWSNMNSFRINGVKNAQVINNSFLQFSSTINISQGNILSFLVEDTLVLLNNQFVIEGVGTFIKADNSTSFGKLYSNYNNYYHASGNIASVPAFGTYYPDLNYLSSQTGLDSNSIFRNPNFQSQTFLFTTNQDSLNNLGTPVDYVIDDIESHPRDLVSPDIGAYEFEPQVINGGIDSLFAPSNFSCSLSDSIIVSFTNNEAYAITSMDIKWKVNNGPYIFTSWSGIIQPNQTVLIPIDSFGFQNDQNYILTVDIYNLNQLNYYAQNSPLNYVYQAPADVEILASQNFVCDSASLTLTSSVLSPLSSLTEWSTGENTDSITVNVGGVYNVSIIDSIGCVSSDTISLISYPQQVPVLIVASDTFICYGDEAILSASPLIAGNSYLWNWYSVTTPTVSVNTTTTVELETTNMNGCVYKDSVSIEEGAIIQSYFISTYNYLIAVNSNGNTFQWLLDGIPIPGATDDTLELTTSGNYSLITTDSFGCSEQSSQQYIDYYLGLTHLDVSDLKVYPIPSSDFIVIENPAHKNISIFLVDVTGRVVKDLKSNLAIQKVDISNLASGVYTVQYTGEINGEIRIIKE